MVLFSFTEDNTKPQRSSSSWRAMFGPVAAIFSKLTRFGFGPFSIVLICCSKPVISKHFGEASKLNGKFMSLNCFSFDALKNQKRYCEWGSDPLFIFCLLECPFFPSISGKVHQVAKSGKIFFFPFLGRCVFSLHRFS